ncbi:MAG: nitroreductase family protein [Dehalococcoidales bacterium]|nr:nitroreductase family protein [Dehalococcoidales bacterium]
MQFIEVNQNTCTKCGICTEECRIGLIEFRANEFPSPVPFIETACVRCGHCVAACPTGSLTHRAVPVEKCVPVQNGLQISPEQCEQLLKSRRSIRLFKKKPVSKEIINKLIDVARYAPTAGNNQCVEWLVIENPDRLDKIRSAITEFLRFMIANQPELAAEAHMQLILEGQENGKDVLLHHAPVLIITHAKSDDIVAPPACAAALTFLELTARSIGVGTCWSGYTMLSAEFPPVKEALTLPEGHSNFGSMLVGYPKHKYHRIPTRKDPVITWR